MIGQVIGNYRVVGVLGNGGARAMKLAVPSTPGDYEIRLHANYPRVSANVVHRIPIVVLE